MIRFSRLLLLAVFLLPTRDGLPRAAAASIEAAPLEEQLALLVNAHRADKNLPPLKFDPRIAAEARRHSRDMASGESDFDHDGFDDRARRLRSFLPWRNVAENIVWATEGSQLAARMMKLWLDSHAHRDNIEDEYDLSGIGAARASNGRWYVTQIFLLQSPEGRSVPGSRRSR